MTAVPLVDSYELESLRAAVIAEDRHVDLSDAVLRSGWENVVLETADWIYRFPRSDDIAFDRELEILAHLDGRLPAATPSVAWIGRRTRFAVYRKLTGHVFDPAAYYDASANDRDALACSLAEFLVAMHDVFDPPEIERLGIPAIGGVHDSVRLDGLPAHLRAPAAAVLTEHQRRWTSVPGPDVVLHNDFHLQNMVLAGPLGPVAGVWDFSCVAVGRATFDLRYFEADSIDLLIRIASRYEGLSGRSVDIDASISANRKEIIGDAIETADLSELTKAVERWT
jgi:aminoglycoside phosphotransferase (APT) family kinase protein